MSLEGAKISIQKLTLLTSDKIAEEVAVAVKALDEAFSDNDIDIDHTEGSRRSSLSGHRRSSSTRRQSYSQRPSHSAARIVISDVKAYHLFCLAGKGKPKCRLQVYNMPPF